MRRIIIPLVFVALLAIATVIPVAAGGSGTQSPVEKHSGTGGCLL